MALAVAATAATADAQQLPTGGSVAAGSATIAQPNAGTLNINQSTNQAIINWQGFSVGQGGTVNFNQPGASSATLNRVLGSTPSSIAGTINAPGTVLLVNPNGIAITRTGVINVGSFAASTLDMKDSDFLAGNYKFTGNGGSAAVSNAGRINVSDGGFAALLGGQVANDGIISAKLGKVGLGAGELITLDLAGDGFLSVAVPSSELGNLVDPNGALVSNSGKIKADGGTVFLSAATASNLLRNAVNIPGSVRTNTVGTREGRIVINGGEGGKVNVTGRLAAKGRKNGNGGAVDITGADIDLAGKIDVSGAGTGAHGGTVYAFADNTLNFGGQILAKGGEGGAGGFVETSGAHVHVADSARVTTLAINGANGTWLIDPNDFTIAAAGGDITGATLSANLAGGNVTILSDNGATLGNGDIFVNDAVSWSANAALTLTAVRNISVNAAITNSGGADINLRADSAGSGTGTVIFGGGQISTSGIVSIFYNPSGNDNTTVNATSYTTPTDYSGNVAGGGTLKSYMLVNTVFDLQNIQNNLSATYALGRDIDASATGSWNAGAGFVPVGSNATPFTGSLTGSGMTISNLWIDRPAESNVGLFGRLDGTVDGVGLIAPEITGNTIVGALAGSNNGIITNSYAVVDICGCGEVSAVGGVGGLVGQSAGIVSGSYANLSVYGTGNSIGGLIGFAGAGSVTNSYAMGTVFGDLISATNVGGLIGSANPSVTVSGSYATGAVEGNTAVGGLIGFNLAAVTDSYATGNVRGTDRIGGLVGWAGVFTGFGSFERVFATGLVGGDPTANSTSIGGLAGQNDGSITDAYATGAVAGDNFVGGLIGFNNVGATATNVYATGFVTFVNGSTANFGALAGTNQGTIANGVWNTQTSGQLAAIGDDSGTSTTFGKSTAQLQAALPAGFDSSIWGIVPGVSSPYMKWRFPSGPTVVSGTASGFTGGDAGLVVGIAIDGTVSSGVTATGADGSYQFMLDPMSAGSAAFTYVTRDGFPAGSSRPSNAVADLVASAPGFAQGHGTGLDFAPDRVLTVAGAGIADMDGVIALMERALYGPSLSSSVPDQLFNLGFNPSSVIRFDSSTTFSALFFAPFGTNYRLQSAAANFNLNQPLGCGCDLNNLEVIGAGNLVVSQPVFAIGSVLMTAPGNITLDPAGIVSADGGGDAIVLAAGGNFINNAGSGAITLSDPAARWLIYSYNSYTAVTGGLDSGNPDILNATYATLPPSSVAQTGNRYLFAVSVPPTTPPATSTTPGGNPPSQTQPPAGGGNTTPTTISFDNNTPGFTPISFTPTPNLAANPPGSDISPAALQDGATGGNGLSFIPISVFDANQYSDFTLPDYAARASEAAIYTIIARAVDRENAATYMINGFWNGVSGAWNVGNAVVSKVSFANGNGPVDPPGGNGISPLAAGTDIPALLKNGPVIIAGAGQPAHWMLATQLTEDGKGVIAIDPITGTRVVLSFDPATGTVGGVTALFEAASNRFVALADAGGGANPQGLAALQRFQPAGFLAVTVK